MKVSIDDVIANINEALAEANDPSVDVDNTIRGVQANQLPPDVDQMEDDLFEKMLINFKRLNGAEPSEEIVDCIRFIARAEAVRRHVYRKLALTRLDEFLDSSRFFSCSVCNISMSCFFSALSLMRLSIGT